MPTPTGAAKALRKDVATPIATSLQGGRPERSGLLFLKLLFGASPGLTPASITGEGERLLPPPPPVCANFRENVNAFHANSSSSRVAVVPGMLVHSTSSMEFVLPPLVSARPTTVGSLRDPLGDHTDPRGELILAGRARVAHRATTRRHPR